MLFLLRIAFRSRKSHFYFRKVELLLSSRNGIPSPLSLLPPPPHHYSMTSTSCQLAPSPLTTPFITLKTIPFFTFYLCVLPLFWIAEQYLEERRASAQGRRQGGEDDGEREDSDKEDRKSDKPSGNVLEEAAWDNEEGQGIDSALRRSGLAHHVLKLRQASWLLQPFHRVSALPILLRFPLKDELL